MIEQKKVKVDNNDSNQNQTDEIGSELETGNEVNAAIEQQGDDATAAIPRDADAAKHEHQNGEADDNNNELTGAP